MTREGDHRLYFQVPDGPWNLHVTYLTVSIGHEGGGGMRLCGWGLLGTSLIWSKEPRVTEQSDELPPAEGQLEDAVDSWS